jgi:hypothetical protein
VGEESTLEDIVRQFYERNARDVPSDSEAAMTLAGLA